MTAAEIDYRTRFLAVWRQNLGIPEVAARLRQKFARLTTAERRTAIECRFSTAGTDALSPKVREDLVDDVLAMLEQTIR